jgi:hypothetical protein
MLWLRKAFGQVFSLPNLLAILQERDKPGLRIDTRAETYYHARHAR